MSVSRSVNLWQIVSFDLYMFYVYNASFQCIWANLYQSSVGVKVKGYGSWNVVQCYSNPEIGPTHFDQSLLNRKQLLIPIRSWYVLKYYTMYTVSRKYQQQSNLTQPVWFIHVVFICDSCFLLQKKVVSNPTYSLAIDSLHTYM